MNLFSILWQFIILWCGIYIFVFIIKFYTKPIIIRRKSHSGQSNILPTYAEDSEIEEVSSISEPPRPPLSSQDTNSNTNNNTTGGDNSDNSKTDEWFIHLFQVRYTTQRMNNLFGKWARLFPNFWHIWFSMGVIIGGLTMVIGIIVMLVAALKIVFFIGTTLFALSQSTTTTNNQLQPYVKRDIMMEAQEVEEVMEDDNNQLFLPMFLFLLHKK
ncbi:hypothetical protein BJ944DRAFT_79154 [Cunninghamella echinulata]|nr:hypothetical protein BJ944DRAFT_79154 [Cunninghamella echinulata]